jgi:hypothetical protein
MLRVAVLCVLLVTEGGCTSDGLVGAEETVSWQSPRMRAIEQEYDALWELDSKKQSEPRAEGKRIYGETVQACTRLFKARLSYDDLRQLAVSCDTLPLRFQDRRGGFDAAVLEFMVQCFVAMGDRDALVTLLSTRFLDHIGWTLRIEQYLVGQESLLQDFRGNRLKDSILILGEAYSKCKTPEVRHEIAVAVRRAFAQLGIEGADDAEFVANAMRWYQAESEHLVVNDKYSQDEIKPLAIESDFSGDPPPKKLPLFVKSDSPKRDYMRIVAVLVIWLIHAGIALILSAPVLFFGRRRVQWRRWELLVVILPFTAWLLLMASQFSVGRKGVANIEEAFILALGVPIVAVLRVVIGDRLPQSVCAGVFIFLLCAGAVAVFFTAPPMLVILG